MDLDGADLTRADVTFADLSGKDLTLVVLAGADLSGAYLNGANLIRVKLDGELGRVTGSDGGVSVDGARAHGRVARHHRVRHRRVAAASDRVSADSAGKSPGSKLFMKLPPGSRKEFVGQVT